MLPQEIIRRKRDGQALSEEEIGFFVRGVADGSIAEGQVAAFAMTVFHRGMSEEETVALTRHMTGSGRRLHWHDLDLPGPVLDKHSTGGVGDKVSLMLAPILAAAGGFVPMISGRGLGHTGGTLDKLASIPGYRSDPDPAHFRRVVREAGCAIIGQTEDLAPADRRLYAVRDVTATVESIPLITASILSKKLAAGLDALVMDIKCGSGAFADSLPKAQALARSIVTVGEGAGLATVALITDMDQPLGAAAGNALEVAEALAYLEDDEGRDPRLHEVTLALAGELLHLGGLADDFEQGRVKAAARLADGSAREAFARMVAALGGPTDFADRALHHLPRAPINRPCLALRSGVISRMDTRRIGLIVLALGGGRTHHEAEIDHAVGLDQIRGLGESLQAGEPIAMIHARDEASWEAAAAALREAVEIGEEAPAVAPVVGERIRGTGRRS